MVFTKRADNGEAISRKDTKCPTCGSPQHKKAYLLSLFLTISLVSGGVGYLFGNSGISIFSTLDTAPSPKNPAMDDVQLMDFSYSKGGFGNIMMASFTIYNKGSDYIKDVVITCAHFAKSRTLIDSTQGTIYDVVPPRSNKRIKDFNMGPIHPQTDNSVCKITDLKV